MARPSGKRQSYTVMGVTFRIDEEGLAKVADDYRLFDDLTSREALVVFRGVASFLKAMLGSDYERVLNELQGDDETLSLEKVLEFYKEAGAAIGSLKN